MKKLILLSICYYVVTFCKAADPTLAVAFTNQLGVDSSLYLYPDLYADPLTGYLDVGGATVAGDVSTEYLYTTDGSNPAFYFRAINSDAQVSSEVITFPLDQTGTPLIYGWTVDGVQHISLSPMPIPEPPAVMTAFWAGFGFACLIMGFKWQKKIAMKAAGGYGDV